MNYKGQPCADCGNIIDVYSTSGLCRECWHKRRGEFTRHSDAEIRIAAAIERHRNNLHNYHSLNVNSVPVPEHRYVLEKATGKKIPKSWIVHHLNGLKGDNRVENLIAMPKGDHDSKALVNALKKRIRELEQLHLPL